jgi:hypothetical protein
MNRKCCKEDIRLKQQKNSHLIMTVFRIFL